jgi:hypothetical protein
MQFIHRQVLCGQFWHSNLSWTPPILKYLKMMSIMMIFFNAHAWVYVWWASLISMAVMQALVRKKTNLQCLCPPGIGWLKKFQCPCPLGFIHGFWKNALPTWYDWKPIPSQHWFILQRVGLELWFKHAVRVEVLALFFRAKKKDNCEAQFCSDLSPASHFGTGTH